MSDKTPEKTVEVKGVAKANPFQNIYTKLLAVRREISDLKLKQGGKNGYANYTYFELADFEPAAIKLCEEYRIIPLVDYGPTMATLTFVDADDTEKTIAFHSPMPDLLSSMQKGNTLIQTQGSLETYTRRYLYLTAFELVQTDTEEADIQAAEQKGKDGKSAKASASVGAYTQHDVDILVNAIGSMLVAMNKKEGSMQKFQDFKTTVLNNPGFTCQKATPADYETLKSIQTFLIKSGYSGSSL